MSKYTTQVRFICETSSGLSESVGLNDVAQVIRNSIPKIFDFYFPIFDENYKPILCEKILKHYYTREIGAETVGLWKLWLNMRLNEIMPYYNKLYETELLEFNPLYEVDYTRTGNKENNGTKGTTGSESGNTSNTGTVNTTTEETTNTTDEKESTNEISGEKETISETVTSTLNGGTKKDKYSDTPQGTLTNIENDTYLTNVRITEDNNSGTITEEYNDKTNDSRIEKLSGKNEITGGKNNESTRTDNLASSFTKSFDNNDVIHNMDEYTEHVIGKMSTTSYAKLITEFRNTFLNIDRLIIDELSDLFMNIY